MTKEMPSMMGFLVIAHAVESVLGFGATVIALGFWAHFFPVDRLVVMLVLIALLQSAFLVARWFRHIEWSRMFRFIVPVSLAGVIAGIMVRNLADDGTLKMVLGAFIISLFTGRVVCDSSGGKSGSTGSYRPSPGFLRFLRRHISRPPCHLGTLDR